MFRLNFRSIGLLLIAAAWSVLVPVSAHAQAINSSAAMVTINATLTETLTITATPMVSIALVSGGTSAAATVAISSNWLLKSTRSAVTLYSSFATPSAALTDGLSPATTIPSSLVLGSMATGTPTSFTAFSQSNTLGTASGGLLLYTQSITNTNRASSRSDNLQLEINLTSLPQFPAGTYSGTLTLQAQSM